jgi:hypothetical protein
MKINKKLLHKIVATFIRVFLTLTIQIFQVVVIGGYAIYIERPFEFIFIFVGFQIGRTKNEHNYHALTVGACTLISLISFGVACKIVPDIGTSLIIQMPMGAALAFGFSLFEEARQKYGWLERNKDGDS